MIRKLALIMFGPAIYKVEFLLSRQLKHATAGRHRLARLYAWRLERQFGIHVSIHAQIGEGLIFPHPTGIVIGRGAQIGARVMIYQGVTIGAQDISEQGGYPTIGDRTVIYAGAVIVGPICIGRDCVVGANSVVLSDMPDGSVATGVPARIRARRSA